MYRWTLQEPFENGAIDLGLQGHFGLKLTDICKFDNSSRVQLRISLIAHYVYLETLHNPIAYLLICMYY